MIGILSDTHDNLDAVRDAVRVFQEYSCELVIHAGDFVAPFAALALSELICPVHAVFGNCDGEKKGLGKAFQGLGQIQEEPFIFNHSGLTFLLTHTPFNNASHISSGLYDVLVFGHTHKPDVKSIDDTLVINPGEAGGWVTGEKTVALLDSDTKQVQIIELK